MAVLVVGLVLLLAMVGQSDANFCVCNTGLNTSVLQRNIDYACGNGADCSAINSGGACYNPNTVPDHCNYAVNSYYQRRGQVSGSCVFTGSATVVQAPPGNVASGCVYQSSPSNGGSTTPPTGGGGTTPPTGGGGTLPPTGGGGTTPPTGGGGTTPPTGGGGLSPPGAFPPPNAGGGTNNPGLVPGSSFSPPGIGLAPTGSGFDNGASVTLLSLSTLSMLVFLSLTPLLSGLMWI